MSEAGESTEKTRRGRPLLITPEALESNRNHQHGNFDNGWGEVGWELSRAKTIESLRRALEPLRGRPELEPFVREPRSPSTWKEVREGREAISKLMDRLSPSNRDLWIARDRRDKIKGALLDSRYDDRLQRAY